MEAARERALLGRSIDGGTALFFSYYDLLSRNQNLGVENAYARLKAIENWYYDVWAFGGEGTAFYAEYYQDKCEQGHAYAYIYPGMNKILQAAGRVIRREDDRGVVVLIDDRYREPTYARLFPPHWRGLRYVGDAADLRELVRRFWGGEALGGEKN